MHDDSDPGGSETSDEYESKGDEKTTTGESGNDRAKVGESVCGSNGSGD